MTRDLTPAEVAAMWMYQADYASSGLGAIEFWKQLNPERKKLVRKCVQMIRLALERQPWTSLTQKSS